MIKLKYLSFRITPACAGSIKEAATIELRPRDHPRLRGEHGHPGIKLLADSRITPACAGSIAMKSSRIYSR